MPSTTAPATVAIRPIPGAEILGDVPTSPALAAWLTDAPPGSPVVITVDGWIRRPSSEAVSIVVAGSVFDGVIYGDRAEVSADLVMLQALGLAPRRQELYADLAVEATIGEEVAK